MLTKKILEEKILNLESIFDSVNDLIFICDKNGYILNVNQSVLEKLKISKKKLLKMHILEIHHPDYMKRAEEAFHDIINGKKDAVAIPFISKDGDIIHVETKITQGYLSNRKVYFGISRDITDKILAKQKINEIEQNYRKIFKSLPDSFLLVSSDSTILDYNSTGTEFYVSPEKIMNAKLTEFLSPDLGKQILDRIERVLETKKLQILEFSLNLGKNTRFFEARFLFLSKKKVLIFIRDNTDNKESEISLTEYSKKLEAINRIIIAGNNSEDLPSLLDEILNQTIKLLDFVGGGIYLIDKIKKIAELVSFKNLPKDFVEFIRFRKINQEPYKTVFVNGQPIFSENYNTIEAKVTDKWDFLSIAIIPLISNDEIIGALNITSKSHHKFTFQEKDILISIGREIGIVISKIEAEETIRKGKKFLSNLFSSIQDGICILDKNYNIIQSNPTMNKWFSHKMPLDNLKCFQVFHDRDEPCENCICYDVIETGKPCINISQRKGPNGEILGILEIYTFPFYDQDTGIITGIIEYLRDVSNQYLAEEKLRLSEEKSRGILENIKEGYFEIDLQGNFTFFNEALSHILGYSENELMDVNINQFVDDITNKEIREFLYEIYKTEIPQTSFQIVAIKKNNERIFLEASVYLRYDKIAKKVGFCGLIRDITEAKIVEQMVTEEIRKLKELDKMKNEFMLRVSHELKTPLNLVCSASSRLLESYKDKLSTREKQLVEVINKGGERLEKLIKDLLDLSQIEYGELELDKHNENISELVERCINDIYYLLIERELNLELNIQNDIFAEVDKIRIEQVIFNLLSNAIKYTPKKGIIAVNIKKKKKYVEIVIRDTGVGFTNDEIKKTFLKFGKIERYGKGMDINTEGTGLGLYLSKRIVEAHNGLIWVESKGRYKGSAFIINLPLK